MRLAGGKESRIRQENDYLIAVVSFANGMLAMGICRNTAVACARRN